MDTRYTDRERQLSLTRVFPSPQPDLSPRRSHPDSESTLDRSCFALSLIMVIMLGWPARASCSSKVSACAVDYQDVGAPLSEGGGGVRVRVQDRQKILG